MVKPTTNQKQNQKKEKKPTVSLAEQLKKDKKLQEKALQNTANKWAKRTGFNGDLTISRVADSGKSFHLAVDGKELKNKYSPVGKSNNPVLVSSRAFMNKN